MIQEYDKALLLKIAHKLKMGPISAAEQAYFDRWYNAHQDDVLEIPADYAPDAAPIRDRMHTHIMQQISIEQATPKNRIKPLYKVLAAAVALLLVGYFSYLQLRPQLPVAQEDGAEQEFVIRPGSQSATLTLSNGEQLKLADIQVGEVISADGVLIRKTATGDLRYEIDASASGSLKMNTITTMNGESFTVNLPDGSTVWLNAASSLKYPVIFDKSERKVELDGEAYFEVARNKQAPFTVRSGSQAVEVLGTHFNINAYSNEYFTKTTLVEGSVRVQHLLSAATLKPGQQARVAKDKAVLDVVAVDLEEAVAWKNGYFRFNNEGIESIMRKVARWYNIEVSFDGLISTEKFNGTVSRTKDIRQVLEMLELTNAVHFKIVGRRVTVMR